jgi:uncharacterized GH25 family protein
MRYLSALAFALVVSGSFAQAHELWIEPADYQPAAEGRVVAGLVNGQNFGEGFSSIARIAYIPRWFVRFDLGLGGAFVPVEGRIGDVPALSMPVIGEGLHVAVYQSAGDVVTYDTMEKFEAFVAHKDFPQALAEHRARGLPETRFAEYYTRFSKSLIGVGAGGGADENLGLETELVALDNPYTSGLSEIRVQLFYQGAPRADAQVELFEKSETAEVTISLHRTDADGVAVLPVRPGFAYMVDAVVLRVPDPALKTPSPVVWESLWANLTFAVPAP